MKNKTPSKFIRVTAIAILLIVGIYTLFFLFVDTAGHSTRLKVMAWLALLGLIGFFHQLLTKTGDEREKFLDRFFNGIGFESEKERREANMNLLILIVLVVLGILAVFFL